MVVRRRDAVLLCGKVYLKDFRAHWLSLTLFAVVIVVSALVSLLGPYLFSRLVDSLPRDFMVWMLAFAAYALLVSLCQILERTMNSLALIHAERLEFTTSAGFFAEVIKKTPEFFTNYNPVAIQSALREGANAISSSFFMFFLFLAPALIQVVLSVWLIASVISLSIVGIVIVYGVFFIAVSLLAMNKTNRYLNEAIEAGQENAAFVGNAVTVIEPLRQTGSAQWMERRFIDKANSIFENWRAYSYRQIAFSSITAFALLVQLLVGYLMIYPKYQSGILSIGDVVLFNMLLLQLNAPFEAIGQSIAEMQRVISKFGPYLTIMQEPLEDNVGLEASLHTLVVPQISFDNVSYRYDNGRGASNISFVAKRGELTFITGETGSGKSTLFRLLQKTLTPQNGDIWVGDQNLTDIPRVDWFKMVGIVPQEIQLLNDTVQANIVLGREWDEAKLQRACERAAIIERIAAMPDGFETIVGERGLKLSGGERQRIALARALYHVPQIILLDEASSALDEDTERAIMDQLRSVDDDLIIIAITHRQSSIGADDQIIDLGRPTA